MAKIDELLKELCPDGVEYVKLKDICLNVCSGGTPLTSIKEYYSGSNPWLRTQEVDWNDVYDTEIKISDDAIKNSSAKVIPANCLIVAMYGATAGKCCINRIPLTTNQACCNLQLDERKALVKFVFYWVCKEYQQIKAMGEGSQSNINSQKVKSYPVPLPPLEFQNEVVEILDTFTDAISNLEEELALREKQFEYYCNTLISQADGDVKTLGEIGRMERGNGLLKSDFTEEGFPCIHYGQIHTFYGTATYNTKSFCSEGLAKKLRKAKYGDLLIATTSEDVEACCKATVWLGEGEVAFSGDSYKFSHSQDPKYISYLFKTEEFERQKRPCATGAKVVRVSGSSMEKFKFNFPSLERQQEIVEILDTFEAMIANIKEEIALRTKQYEYYREKLLSFGK